MSENKEDEDLSLVDKVSENVSTDIITDLKTGIYNLFVNLVHNATAFIGPVEAIKMSTSFLDEISESFKKVLEEEEK